MIRATTIHALPGRVRVRIRERRAEPSYFDELARALAKLSLVRATRVDGRTGSVLIEHDGTLDALSTQIAAAGLFELTPPPAREDVLSAVRSRVDTLDAELRSRSRGGVGVETLSFYALLGGAVIQLVRGPVLPASMTLLIQASKMLADRATDKRR